MSRTLTPATYRRICAVAVGLLAAIVVTGGAVRLTGSGLGCSDWPTCEQDQFVPEAEIHGWIEFGNRLITGLVSAVVILAVSGSLLRRPRRPDLVGWSLGLVAGVIGQIVLGGLVVLSHLNPWLVLGHFGLSMVLVWNAVVLHHRAGDPRPWAAPPLLRRGADVITGWAMLVLASGTLVTGSGPHAGSRDEPIERLPFLVRDVARIHGTLVVGFILLVAALVVTVRRHPDLAVMRPWAGMLAVVVAMQAAVGWTQYFTGVPEILVAVHIAGATALWMAVVKVRLTVATVPTPARSSEVGP